MVCHQELIISALKFGSFHIGPGKASLRTLMNLSRVKILHRTWLEKLTTVWLVPAVFAVSMIANAETAHRYVGRAVSGWKLALVMLLTALAPLLCVVVPKHVQRRLYPWIGVLAVGFCAVAWWMVPQESLRVDRWELMSNFLTRLFDGQYPYLASSRFNVPPPVPFPWLYLVGIPAWVVGEIGWFPLVSLALLVFTIPKNGRGPLVMALATSLPVWYELVVRSNIVANAALVGAFLLSGLSRKWFAVVCSGALAGVVGCTRASFVAPILVWAGSEIVSQRRWRDGSIWSGVAIFVALLPFAILIAVWGWPVFRDWNPLRIQGSIQSPWLPLAILALSPWIGMMATSLEKRMAAAFWVSFLPMASLLVPTLLDGSFFNINRGYFEVAFWNSSLVLGWLAWSVPRADGYTDRERECRHAGSDAAALTDLTSPARQAMKRY